MMRNILRTFSLLLLVSIFIFVVSASAQERKGLITGHVTDKQHAILQGARVEVQPARKTTASDNLGQFTVGDLAPGHYTVTISYVGFATFSTEVM